MTQILPEPLQALELLYSHAIYSRNLPPAALPDLQKAAKIIEKALESSQPETKNQKQKNKTNK